MSSDTPMTNVDKRGCTCPAGEIPEPCEQKYALTECRIATAERDLAAANDRIKALEAVHKGTEQSETPPKRVALPNFGAIDYWEDRARKAEAERDALKADAERLQHLIGNAYSGLNKDLEEPFAVGMVIGGKVEWPDGVRAAIDAARKGEAK